MKRLLRVLAVLAALALLAFSLACVFAIRSLERDLAERMASARTEAARIDPLLLADIEELTKVFPVTRGSRDAGAILNRRVVSFTSLYGPGVRGADAMPQEAVKLVLAKWLEAEGNPVVDALDTRWMADLGQFDHWTVRADGADEEEVFLGFFSVPPWCRVRLLQGLKNEALASALADCAELRRLGMTTRDLGGLFGGWQVATDMRRAVEVARSRGVEVDVDLPSQSELDREYRVVTTLWRREGVLGPELPAKYWTDPSLAFGRCAVIRSVADEAHFARRVASSELAAHYAHIEDVLAHPPPECDLTRTLSSWRSDSPTAREVIESMCSSVTPRPLECEPLAALLAVQPFRTLWALRTFIERNPSPTSWAIAYSKIAPPPPAKPSSGPPIRW